MAHAEGTTARHAGNRLSSLRYQLHRGSRSWWRPKATTIELAIYQAIRYDFDLERAALLACLQICLCAGLALISRLVSQDHDTGESLGGTILRSDRTSRFSI